MPVLESTEFTTPRSALRHRPIGDEGAKPGKPTTNAPIPPVQRASRTRSTDTQVDRLRLTSGSGKRTMLPRIHRDDPQSDEPVRQRGPKHDRKSQQEHKACLKPNRQ